MLLTYCFWHQNSNNLYFTKKCSLLRSQDIFVNCKTETDNLCGTKELFFGGGINLITLVYEKKQRLMMALLGVLSLISVCKISLVSNSRTLQKRSSLREVSVGGFFSCPRSSSRLAPKTTRLSRVPAL